MSRLRALLLSSLAASSLVVTFGVATSNAAPELGLTQDNTSKGVVSSSEAQIYIPADVATKMSASGVPASKRHNPEYAELALDDYWTPERMENAIPMDTPGDAVAIPPEFTPAPSEPKKSALNSEAPVVSLSDPVGLLDPLHRQPPMRLLTARSFTGTQPTEKTIDDRTDEMFAAANAGGL